MRGRDLPRTSRARVRREDGPGGSPSPRARSRRPVRRWRPRPGAHPGRRGHARSRPRRRGHGGRRPARAAPHRSGPAGALQSSGAQLLAGDDLRAHLPHPPCLVVQTLHDGRGRHGVPGMEQSARRPGAWPVVEAPGAPGRRVTPPVPGAPCDPPGIMAVLADQIECAGEDLGAPAGELLRAQSLHRCCCPDLGCRMCRRGRVGGHEITPASRADARPGALRHFGCVRRATESAPGLRAQVSRRSQSRCPRDAEGVQGHRASSPSPAPR